MKRSAAPAGAPAVFCLALLTAGFAYTLFEHAGLDLTGWNVWLIVLALAALSYWAFTPQDDAAPPLNRWIAWPLALLPCYVALQVIPLPAGLVGLLSTVRGQILSSFGAISQAPVFVALSVTPEVTFTHLFRILGYTLTFLVVREITWRSARRQWPWMAAAPLIVLGALEAGLGLLQPEDSVQGTYGSRNHFAGLLEMILPLTVAYACALFSRGLNWRTPSMVSVVRGSVALIVAAEIFAASLFSLSRMGFVSCLSGLFATGALALCTREGAWKKTAVTGLLVVCMVGFVWLPPPKLVERFGALDDATGEGRVPIWRDTLRLVEAYPVVGCGLGAYDSAFLRYQTSGVDSTFSFAHNDYLQIAAELGIAGFLIAALLFSRIFGRAMRAAAQTSAADIRFLAIGCAGAMVAIFVHSLADFNLYIPANAAVLAWICGIVAGLPIGSRGFFRPESGRTLMERWANVRTLALVVSAALLLYAPAWILFEAAYKNDPAAEKRFCAFGICDTDAVVSAETILHGSVAAVPASFLIDALKRDVNNPERWCDTGEAMLRAGRLDAAGTCFANALALGHDDPPVLLRSAFYFFDWHQNERALELTARVLRNTSTYDGQVFEAYRKNQVPGAEVLKYGLPRMQRAYESYVRWLMEDGQVEGAMAAWQDAARQGFAGSALANEYVQFLVNHQRPELAAEAWARYAGARRNGYLQSTWVYNGDFEFDPSGSALDWSIEPVAGIDMGVDGSEAHSGSRSLRVHFGGQDNVEFRHITERAYVTPGVYRFVAYVRTDHLTTDQGLSFHVFDPASGSRLDVRTEQVNGTNDWTKLEQSFCVGRQTKLIEVQVVRPASWKFDNKISGTAWIDSVSLVKVGGECRERASGATAVLDARLRGHG